MTTLLEPKLITVLKEGYSLRQFRADLIAGIIVGIVALPLAIAFAIASGVKPEQGLYTAIIAGAAISIFGGSRVQIGGPTGAFIVIVAQIVHQYGYDGLAVATFLAGLMLMVMGFSGMGILLRFIPYPLTIGFTSGIALVIFSTQIKDFLGMSAPGLPSEFIHKWGYYFSNLSTVNFWAIGIAVLSLLIVVYGPKFAQKVPGSLWAIVIATALVHFFHLPVETIGSQYGEVPNLPPAPHMIEISWTLIQKMFSPALTIALLAAIESLLSAVVADGMLGTRHRSNMELIAQGVANVLSPLFLGIPATGAIARTATNIRNGGRTPIAGIIHAVTLVAIMMFCGSWAALIPMPTLAAILVFVAYNMSEWHTFVKMLKSPRGDIAVMLSTFLLTVLIDLTVAIEIGVVLSAFLFLKRMENSTEVAIVSGGIASSEDEQDEAPQPWMTSVPDGVEVFEIFGPLFFGAIDRFKNAMRRVERSPKVLILRMRNVPLIDATGLHAIEDLHSKIQREGATLLISGLRPEPMMVMADSGLAEKIGFENLLPSTEAAIQRAKTILG